MRKIITLLSTTTALFAASTAYLAVRLHGSAPGDTSMAQASCPVKLPAARSGAPADGEGRLVADPEIPGTIDPACNPERARLDRIQAESQATYQAQLRRDLADPDKRAGLLDQNRRLLLANEPGLARYMGLDGAEFDALVALLAEQNLAYTEHFVQCSPDCKELDMQAWTERKSSALRELLGDAGSERYARYEQSREERWAVDSFRAKLPDNLRLSDEQSERLISALADERQKFESDAAARGLRTSSMGGLHGMLRWDENQHTVEERVAAARQYAGRLEARAATVLDAAQLERYSEAQDASIANVENMLPWQDAMEAERTASAAK